MVLYYSEIDGLLTGLKLYDNEICIFSPEYVNGMSGDYKSHETKLDHNERIIGFISRKYKENRAYHADF